jgi:hypothetical protein
VIDQDLLDPFLHLGLPMLLGVFILKTISHKTLQKEKPSIHTSVSKNLEPNLKEHLEYIRKTLKLRRAPGVHSEAFSRSS